MSWTVCFGLNRICCIGSEGVGDGVISSLNGKTYRKPLFIKFLPAPGIPPAAKTPKMNSQGEDVPLFDSACGRKAS